MPVPSNTTPETAIDVTSLLPYNATIAAADVQLAPTGSASYTPTCDAARRNALWYSYTAQPADIAISFLFDCNPQTFSDYTPTFSIWTGTLPTLTQYLSTHYCATQSGVLWRQLVVTPGTTYYFLVTNANATTPLTAGLRTQFQKVTPTTAPLGSLLIPDDTVGFPGVILSKTNGTVLALKTFVACEVGASLPTGEQCVNDNDLAATADVVIYNSGLAQVARVSFTTGNVQNITSDHDATFYVLTNDGVTATLQTVSTLGVIGATTWSWLTAVAPHEIVVSLNGGILYYARTGDTTIRRWNLTTNLAMSDLASIGGTFRSGTNGDSFICADGSVIWTVADSASPFTVEVRHYSAAGTLLHTLSIPVDAAVGVFAEFDHAGYADATTFWVWAHTGTGTGIADTARSRYRRVLIADFSTVLEFGPVATAADSYGPAGDVGVPFHISNSCPLLVLQQPTVPVTSTATYAVRRVRIFTLPSAENYRMFLSRLELLVQAGVGLTTGQGSDPTFTVEISRDGGKTYGPVYVLSPGKLGDYDHRSFVHRLGQYRNATVRIAMSDPVLWAILAGWGDLEKGLN